MWKNQCAHIMVCDCNPGLRQLFALLSKNVVIAIITFAIEMNILCVISLLIVRWTQHVMYNVLIDIIINKQYDK